MFNQKITIKIIDRFEKLRRKKGKILHYLESNFKKTTYSVLN